MLSVEGTDLRLILRPQQYDIFHNLNRFNCLLAHRRFGKTWLSVAVLIAKAQECKHDHPRVHYFAPTYSQAKKVTWDLLKQMTQALDPVINESELRVDIRDTRITLGSAENPDANRGIYSDFAVLDEPAQMSPAMWTEVLRPALSDRLGGCLMIGTPKGRHGLFYSSYEAAPSHADWWRGCYRASETGIIPEPELQAARKVMSTAEYAQEYECDWSAAIRGAFWGDVMNDVEQAGQITNVPHDEQHQVYTAWDLGVANTAIWYFQMVGGVARFIRYEEHSGRSYAQLAAHMGQWSYNYAAHIMPHDVTTRSEITGKTRQATLESLGFDCVVAPKIDLPDGIDMVRSKLRNCWFDRELCQQGIETLRSYRSDWKDKHGVLSKQPLHDWASHGADAMRYFAVTDVGAYTGAWGEPINYSNMDIKYG